MRDVVEGTEVELFATFTPANALAFVAIPLTGKRAMARTMLYLDEYLCMNAAGTAVEKRPQMKSRYALRSVPLERWAGELEEEERGIAAKLCDHLAVSDDDGVVDTARSPGGEAGGQIILQSCKTVYNDGGKEL